MTLHVSGTMPNSVFGVFGSKENTATLALGWCLNNSSALLSAILCKLGVKDASLEATQITLQSHGKDKGYTDIELLLPGKFHIIIEAKKGWLLPSALQFEKYAARFDSFGKGDKFFVSVSSASQMFAKYYLPAVSGVTIKHLSWTDIRSTVRRCRASSKRIEEKLWLRELGQHLGGYVSAQDQISNLVYVVSLGKSRIAENNPYTWIDVVEKDGRYFHPYGGNGWPTQPPTYIGFRYDGMLKSIHHIDAFEVVPDLLALNQNWGISPGLPHFLYTLGPAIRPVQIVRTGKLFKAQRVHCMIDTLLSGAFPTIREARDETKRRLVDLETDVQPDQTTAAD